MQILHRFLLLLLLGAAFLGSPAPLAANGYWGCENDKWVVSGNPVHPRPLKECGYELAIPKSQGDCEQAGGHWGPAGIFPKPICRMPTRDGGRICGDDGECEGMCLARPSKAEHALIVKGIRLAMTGTCTPHIPVFGCMAIVERGHVSGIMCRD